MTKAVFVKRDGALVPAEYEAAELLCKIAEGVELVVDVRQPRNVNFFKRWWKLCTIVAENMPSFQADKRGVSDMILIACHMVHWRINPHTGDMTPVPHSIAAENMEEDEAQRLWRRAIFYVLSNWLHIGPVELEAAVGDFLAGPQARSLGKRVPRALPNPARAA